MEFAERVHAVEPAAPFVISNLVSELEEQEDADIVDLSVGQPDVETPQHVIDATKDALDAGHTTYTPSNGLLSLRESIAGYLQDRFDLDYGPENIIATPGGKHALYETLQAIVDPGDEVIVIDPVWSSYEPMVKLAGGEAVHVGTAPYDFQLEPALDDLEAAVSDDTALIMLNSPNNPSGMVFSEAAFEGVRDIAVEYDLPVLSDEIYAELLYGDNEQRSLATYDGMMERTITINGFSKTFSMTGYRLGFMAAPTDHTTQAGKVHSHSVSCASNFVQRAGIEALENTDIDAFTGDMMETFEARRDLLVDLLEERDINVMVPEGAFYVMFEIDSDDDMEYCKDAVREAGVGLVPGQAFNTPGYVRASLVETESRIQEGIDRLEDAGFL
ncbi:pyridoxal phosphate-dependent aminotransferase [Halodesulfurarchaeum sp. HSR-GB]|uniref:pyridoxal phosphate-dependent aminotransferase n=1 Tax=Halodesulfurarchaeum sp. HSR-GB TaxID=3074077 RepID=UPI00285800C1|nr:pyridoxal phosphate-dependent aminotransferase [Halodesulfurarchaeum sp. HSR-GB]MDR5657062.1 pyridoxal phosphate-dependent aminotransferase [Halodesulfurarchaeum sp. HSR-GB]